jgi:hypothetical protein
MTAYNGNLSVGVQTDDDVYYGRKSGRLQKIFGKLAVSWYRFYVKPTSSVIWSAHVHEMFTERGKFLVRVAEKREERKKKKGRKKREKRRERKEKELKK